MKNQGSEGARGGRQTGVEGPRSSSRGNAHPGQGAEGARKRAQGHGQGFEGSSSKKDNSKDVTLGEGLEMGSVHSAHKKGLVHGQGAKQAASVAPSGMSDHDTLRHGSRPQPEKVNNIPTEDKGTQKKAYGFNKRSEQGGAEKEGGY